MGKSLRQRVNEVKSFLGNPYAFFTDKDLTDTLDESLYIDAADLRCGQPKQASYTPFDIEQIAIRLQRDLWMQRGWLFTDPGINDPLHILDPEMALRALGYRCEFSDALGQFQRDGLLLEIAAELNTPQQCVKLSRAFSAKAQKFTLAHQLGHVLLHDMARVHQDRSFDGSMLFDGQEQEANLLAGYFLMPQKLVRRRFFEYYGTENCWLPTAATAQSLFGCELKNSRELAILLAKNASFNGQDFTPLATTFGVTEQAMANRLLSLGLCSLSPRTN
ncbi:ImmA/IrrE family metallo-endopeptidase [Gallaecimonas mangrovi]|uniref:ImmA/IrrE family metallo-endopeptidase n=1 Tax=Gallaecimonas mangrovi TaxID=2291597 RepID=UPI000E1FFF0D|nr:ImmA/IrrE family metallo-endopeptidase [Gallaecimonas mangrovi]